MGTPANHLLLIAGACKRDEEALKLLLKTIGGMFWAC